MGLTSLLLERNSLAGFPQKMRMVSLKEIFRVAFGLEVTGNLEIKKQTIIFKCLCTIIYRMNLNVVSS